MTSEHPTPEPTTTTPSHMPDDAPLLLHHEYDGIKEYDNPTPSWWHLIFLATIIFSAFYAFFAIFSPLYPSPQRTHAAAEERDFARKFAAVGDLQPDEQTIHSPAGVSAARAATRDWTSATERASRRSTVGMLMAT